MKLFRTPQWMPLKSERTRRGTPTMTERSCNCVVRARLKQGPDRVDPGGEGLGLWCRWDLRGEVYQKVGLLGGSVGPEERQEWSLEAAPRQGRALSDLSSALAGELYDLDATSLQLKVLQYVSP